MGKPSLFCADILGDFDRLSDGEVGGVGIFAESVNDQNGNVADLISDRDWDCGAIGQVSGAWLASDIDTESGGRNTSVRDGKGSKSGGTY